MELKQYNNHTGNTHSVTNISGAPYSLDCCEKCNIYIFDSLFRGKVALMGQYLPFAQHDESFKKMTKISIFFWISF